ncbi:hypothetical protein C8F04DRAFT_1263444 [Mycena alexandri]|uniref:Uncharacterized protein n=1 Tax=Mycena alexandri TaxID=1745969 RepID=A0AAD6SNW6_9AGAR|nr:hypothetical protein C8F04DRAFT_1263444 [Mycena alexandri]
MPPGLRKEWTPTFSTSTQKITRVRVRMRTHHPKHTQPDGGYREPRTTALTRADLYEDGRLPLPLQPLRPSQRCSLCTAVKSHPVSHCYACIRLWLEQDWKCPVTACRTVLRTEPHRHFAEEQALAEAFPNWVNATVVTYNWEGLTFPKVPAEVVTTRALEFMCPIYLSNKIFASPPFPGIRLSDCPDYSASTMCRLFHVSLQVNQINK